MNKKKTTTPFLLDGKKFIDDRGYLSWIDGLQMTNFVRFYVVENHAQKFIRAWHGHLQESKLFFPITGAVLVACVSFKDPNNPDKSAVPERFVLDSTNPQGLMVPGGFANGFMTLTEGAKLLIFSSATLEESKADDYRFAFDFWNVWDIKPR